MISKLLIDNLLTQIILILGQDVHTKLPQMSFDKYTK